MSLDSMSASPWISFEVFSYLNVKELAACSLVCKAWNQHTSYESLWRDAVLLSVKHKYKFAKISFKPLTLNIRQILNSPCPIWEGKKIFQTHMLIFIPKRFRENPLCLSALRGSRKFRGFNYTGSQIFSKFEEIRIVKSCWVLMLKEALPESLDQGYSQQQILVKKLSQKAGVEYVIPSMLEALWCIFMYQICSGKYLYDKSWIRCSEQMNSAQIAIGVFTDCGIVMTDFSPNYPNLGVAPLRRL